jgi:hypothetical protein
MRVQYLGISCVVLLLLGVRVTAQLGEAASGSPRHPNAIGSKQILAMAVQQAAARAGTSSLLQRSQVPTAGTGKRGSRAKPILIGTALGGGIGAIAGGAYGEATKDGSTQDAILLVADAAPPSVLLPDL